MKTNEIENALISTLAQYPTCHLNNKRLTNVYYYHFYIEAHIQCFFTTNHNSMTIMCAFPKSRIISLEPIPRSATTRSGTGTFMTFVTLDLCFEGDHSIIDSRWSESSVASVKADTFHESLTLCRSSGL